MKFARFTLVHNFCPSLILKILTYICNTLSQQFFRNNFSPRVPKNCHISEVIYEDHLGFLKNKYANDALLRSIQKYLTAIKIKEHLVSRLKQGVWYYVLLSRIFPLYWSMCKKIEKSMRGVPHTSISSPLFFILYISEFNSSS